MNDATRTTNYPNCHREACPSEAAAKRFEDASKQTATIPTVHHRELGTCYVELVETTPFEDHDEETQRSLFCDYITALQHGIQNDIYHLDIKHHHLGHTGDTGVLLDWGDAYFLNESSAFFFTIKPHNINEVFDDTTPEKLENAIISQVAQLAYDLDLLDSNEIHTSPNKHSLDEIKEVIQPT